MKYIIELDIREKDVDGNLINIESIIGDIYVFLDAQWNIEGISIDKKKEDKLNRILQDNRKELKESFDIVERYIFQSKKFNITKDFTLFNHLNAVNKIINDKE